MSEALDRFNEFVDSQVKILEKANHEITENALKFHKEYVTDHHSGCEAEFLTVFLMAYNQKLREGKYHHPATKGLMVK